MYRPLPKELTIKTSSIDGLGLFTTCDVEEGHEFGITHIQNKDFQNGYIRTPMGGFINNSDDPNCILIHENTSAWKYMKLKSIKFISESEEITLKYQYMGYDV